MTQANSVHRSQKNSAVGLEISRPGGVYYWSLNPQLR
jgi:hypothetical protein